MSADDRNCTGRFGVDAFCPVSYTHLDVPEFRQRLHREVIDETYPKLHELLRPLSQEDIDTVLCAWNGNIESKHAVVRLSLIHI